VNYLYKILIVEDDFLIRWSLSQALIQEGYEVITAEDGRKGLEAIQTEQFDYIITDIVMPEIDGWQLLENVHQKQPSSRVIVMTAHADRYTGGVAKEKGAWAYIEKSYLIEGVKTILKEGNFYLNDAKGSKATGTNM
jgi:DNA-binding NtrC family response regulator